MPLGWYLAQGLVPLGPSSSDDEEGPCELPNGKLICGPHGLVTCVKCCTSYDFGNDTDDDDFWASDGDESAANIGGLGQSAQQAPRNIEVASQAGLIYHMKLRKGSGQAFFSRFMPPAANISPMDLFSGRMQFMAITRMIHRDDHSTGIIFTDGACLNNGRPNPKAGWGFHHGFLPDGQPALYKARLKSKAHLTTQFESRPTTVLSFGPLSRPCASATGRRRASKRLSSPPTHSMPLKGPQSDARAG